MKRAIAILTFMLISGCLSSSDNHPHPLPDGTIKYKGATIDVASSTTAPKKTEWQRIQDEAAPHVAALESILGEVNLELYEAPDCVDVEFVSQRIYQFNTDDTRIIGLRVSYVVDLKEGAEWPKRLIVTWKTHDKWAFGWFGPNIPKNTGIMGDYTCGDPDVECAFGIYCSDDYHWEGCTKLKVDLLLYPRGAEES